MRTDVSLSTAQRFMSPLAVKQVVGSKHGLNPVTREFSRSMKSLAACAA